MTKSWALCCLALVLFGAVSTAVAPPAAQADVMERGQRRVGETVAVDYGAFADRVTWRYETKAGDTLGSVAKEQLGSEARQADIVTLNPSVAKTPLSPRTKLVMPPKSKEGTGPRGIGWWDLIHVGHGGGGPVSFQTALYPNEPWPYEGGSVEIYAVPHDLAAGIGTDSTALASDPAVASVKVHFGDTVRESDPTERIVSHYRLELTGDRTLALRLLEQKRLGKDGRVLSQATGGPAPAADAGPPWVLLLLAGAALGALVLLARHRRRRSPSTHATS